MQIHGWNSVQVGWGLTIHSFCGAIFGIFFGRLTDRYGAKKNIYTGAVLFGMGWCLIGQVQSLLMFYLVYGVIAGAGAGMMYIPAISTVARWFPDRPGRIAGFLLTSCAAGPAIIAPAAAILIDKLSLQTAFILIGLIFLAIIVLVGWMINAAPIGYKPAGWETNPRTIIAVSGGPDHTWQQMVKTAKFWLLLTLYICSATPGFMLIRSVSDMAQKQIGVTAVVAAYAISTNTIGTFIGCLVFGLFFDKIGACKSLYIIFTISIVVLLLMTVATTWPLFVVCLILLGASFGGAVVIFQPISRKQFGIKNLGANYGILFLGYAGGAFLGPLVSSYFIDKYNTFSGSYLVAIAISAAGILLTFMLARTDKNKTLVEV